MAVGPGQYVAPAGTAGTSRQRSGAARIRLFVAAGLAVVAAGLAVVAMFLDYMNYKSIYDGDVDYSEEWAPWTSTVHASSNGGNTDSVVPLYGIVLSLLIVALLAGAVLAVRASRAGIGAARAAAFVYCTATVVMQLMLSLSMIAMLGTDQTIDEDAGIAIEHNIRAGYWVMLGMTVLAVVAAILTWLPAGKTGTSPGAQYASPWYQQHAQQYPQYDPYSQYQQYPQYEQYPQYQQYQQQQYQYPQYQQPQAPPSTAPPEGYGQQYPPQ